MTQRKSDSKLKTILLLGAGTSAEAGIPTTREITKALLDFAHICPSDDAIFIENLLQYLQVKLADFYRMRAVDVNFEQILGALIELVFGPKDLNPFLGQLDPFVIEAHEKISGGISTAINRLFDLLCEFLEHSGGDLRYLDDLIAFATSFNAVIYSLNYDLALESRAKQIGTPLITGFADIDDEVVLGRWDPSTFSADSDALRLYKLHGSADWVERKLVLEPEGEAYNSDVYRRAEYYTAFPPAILKIRLGRDVAVKVPEAGVGFRSIMNFGIRKERMYASPQFVFLFEAFRRGLESANIVVVVGYSFRDKSINDYLLEKTLTRDGDLKLLLVAPRASSLIFDHPILGSLHRRNLVGYLNTVTSSAFSERMIQDAIADLISKPVDQRKLSLRPPPEIWERSDKDFKIVESWRRFLRTMDRLYYRAIEVQNLLNNSSDGEEISCGMQRFFEIVSMAHTRLNAVYQAMEFGLGVYEREVKVPRERLGKPNSEEFDKWKKEFLSAVSYAYNKAFMNSAEFIEAITDPEYERLWLQSDPRPSKYQMAELVVRDTCSRVSDVAWLCSKILNTLGMEAPFTGFDDRQSSDTSISE